MIPLRDDNPTRSTPIVTITLIVLNVVVFLYELMYGIEAATWRYALIPAHLTTGQAIVAHGAHAGLPPGIEITNLDPAWVTVFAAMFMHGGFAHIIGNMWYLWIFGNNIEDELGPGKFLAFYLLSGVAAAGAQVVLDPHSTIPMVGASGAIAGVLGAYLVLFPGSRVLCLTYTFVITTFYLPAWAVLGFWFVLQFISGLGMLGHQAGGVAYAAHVGGFAAGWLLIRVFALGRQPPTRQWRPPADDVEWR